MKVLLSSLLFLSFSLITSCSSGSDSKAGNKPGPTINQNEIPPAKPQVQLPVIGTWSNPNNLELIVEPTSMKLAVKCNEGGNIRTEVPIMLTDKNITLIEAREVENGNCRISLSKDMVLPYRITGDHLMLTVETQNLELIRINNEQKKMRI